MRFVVLIEYTDLVARERALADHRAYLKEGRERGCVIASGPFADGKGGMYILEFASEPQAQAFVAADPYTRAGMSLMLRAWTSSQDDR